MAGAAAEEGSALTEVADAEEAHGPGGILQICIAIFEPEGDQLRGIDIGRSRVRVVSFFRESHGIYGSDGLISDAAPGEEIEKKMGSSAADSRSAMISGRVSISAAVNPS
jgi:hypothetical protein